MKTVDMVILEELLDDLTGELDYLLQELKHANECDDLDGVDYLYSEMLKTLDNKKIKIKEHFFFKEEK
ncbi:MAG TPA: hypothetical protein P5134_05040 [Bacteroidales bacterium]|nr:hypothetical protein [Bacteroidales bacterium]